MAVRDRRDYIHLEKLKFPEMTTKYENKLHEALETCNTKRGNMDGVMRYSECTVEETWRAIKNAIKDAEEDVLELRSKRERNEWFDQECTDKIRARNAACMNYLARPIRAKRRE